MKRLCKECGGPTVTSLCKLFGVTKQAFYKYVDHSMDTHACERFVLEFVKRVREKDPGIGGEKLWLMYRNEFGTSSASVGRDCFCAILSKYHLDEDSVTGRAFLSLAASVVRQVDRRNVEMAPTQIVEMHK